MNKEKNMKLNPAYRICVLGSLLFLALGVQSMLINAGFNDISVLFIPFGIEFLLGASFLSIYKDESCQTSKRKR